MIINSNKSELKRLGKIADKIISMGSKYSEFSQEEIISKVEYWKGLDISDYSIEDVFALCREVTVRVLNKSQYRVQLIGGLVLSEGRIAEMRTGEGKTLTELCPAFYNALSGEGVHILTVNDYLCERDYEEMRHVFEYAGLTVGLVVNSTDTITRQSAYNCDITYTTNTEVGFDYLRDNTVTSSEQQVLRGLNYVIIDELDSVLIDDASTPLILAEESSVDRDIFERVTGAVTELRMSDVEYNLKENYVVLTESGIKLLEDILNMDNLSYKGNGIMRHVIYQCLKAKYLFRKDKEYIISNGEIVLIDTNTGRIADGRKLSDGLHQAIEAKERVDITNDTATTASITYQNFFKLYKKVSGMSGTIQTDKQEMEEFYSLDVVVIPTNRPVKRIDEEDIVCKSKQDKYERIVKDVAESIKRGIPVLIGTMSIRESEELAGYLSRAGISLNLLNAKTKSEEADIISKAGERGTVTIATNIAGRGTDIKITDEVNRIGGLRVIATERNLARRVDNQLIGRSGRQGNNGSSIFYLCPEDELFKEYCTEEIKEKLPRLHGKRYDKYVKNNIYKSQRTTQNQGFDSRKDIIKRDYIINLHREIIYKQRQDILTGKYTLGINLAHMIYESISEIVGEDYSIDRIVFLLNNKFNMKLPLVSDNLSTDEIIDNYSTQVVAYYNSQVIKTEVNMESVLRNVLISIMDKEWVTHLESMEQLKRSSDYQSYMQKDPYVYFRIESGKMFSETTSRIRDKFLNKVFYDLVPQLAPFELAV